MADLLTAAIPLLQDLADGEEQARAITSPLTAPSKPKAVTIFDDDDFGERTLITLFPETGVITRRHNIEKYAVSAP